MSTTHLTWPVEGLRIVLSVGRVQSTRLVSLMTLHTTASQRPLAASQERVAPVFHWHVVVDTHEHAFSSVINVLEGLFRGQRGELQSLVAAVPLGQWQNPELIFDVALSSLLLQHLRLRV